LKKEGKSGNCGKEERGLRPRTDGGWLRSEIRGWRSGVREAFGDGGWRRSDPME
jgi:hypothetical protein